MNAPSNSCPDCGNAPVHHFAEKFSVAVSLAYRPFIDPGNKIWCRLKPYIPRWFGGRLAPWLLEKLAALRLGVFAHEPDERTTGRARAFWNECARRGVKLSEFRFLGKGRELFLAEWNGTMSVFDGLPRPGPASEAVYWMDDKARMREKFQAAGIKVARGGRYFAFRSLARDFKRLTPPVIIKPHTGSRSRHTTTHIETFDELKTAFRKAKQLSPFVVMEEEHEGFVHRVTLIGGAIAGVLRREPPYVVGDGVHTLAELIEIENRHPLRDETVFHKISVGADAQAELVRQQLALSDIPASGRIVTLSQKASRGLGGGAIDVTDLVHPDNTALFHRIAETLRVPLVGVDFIIGDIGRSWTDQPRSGVIECNSLPFIDLHLFPLSGRPRDTAGMLADLAFPGSRDHGARQEPSRR